MTIKDQSAGYIDTWSSFRALSPVISSYKENSRYPTGILKEYCFFFGINTFTKNLIHEGKYLT